MTEWEDVRAADLEPGDVILSRYGPARVREWRWSRIGGITVDAIMLDTGLVHVLHFAEQGRALRKAKPRQGAGSVRDVTVRAASNPDDGTVRTS